MPRRLPAVLVSLALTAPLLLLAPPASAAPTVPAKPYDFDGDGFPELAIGVPALLVGTVQAGGVVVLPASRKGLSLDEQVITQQTPGVPDGSGPDEYSSFATSVTSADFDRDGYADLAVAGYSGLRDNASTVTVLFGSARGLSGTRAYLLKDDSVSASALQAADFDGDGWVDLAVGEPLADPPADAPAKARGAVRIYRGGQQGFASARSSRLSGVRQGAGVDLRFGSALAVGDLNGDGVADLAVSAPGPEGFGDGDEGFQNPGSVSVCYGGKGGPSSCTRLVRGFAYAGSESIAVGNVSGDARPEIVLGIPVPEIIYDPSDVYQDTRLGGALEILTLSGSGGATTAAVKELTQGSKGVPGSNEAFDDFGRSLALGDLDRDGYADLVVGAPGEDVGKKRDAGRVTVVYGATKGYRTSGNKIYDQGTKGVPGKPEKNDQFGGAVALLDHDGDGRLDLTVGAPTEDSKLTGTTPSYPGAATTLQGKGRSFTTKGARTFGLKTLGYPQAEGSEFFGAVLGQ